MNKLFLSLLSMSTMGNVVFAQTKTQEPFRHRTKQTLDAESHNYQNNRGGVTPLWSDDFSNSGNWSLGYAAGAPALNWQIGIGLVNTGNVPTSPIESTTAANGYAMLDSDGFNNQSLVESSTMTTADPIDLSAVQNVVLQFESFYRKWNSEECYVVISTNNTDWPALNPTSDISALPNVFKVWPGMAVQAVISNPTLVRINISAAAGGQSQVWVRFHWTGTYGYSWFVDDAAIIEQPANDVVLNTSFLSHTGNGEEYGRVPASQLNPTMLVGGDVLNFGYEDQNNVEYNVEVLNDLDEIAFSFSGSQAVITAGDTVQIQDNISIPTLANGLYRSIASVTSDEEQDGLFFSNNGALRNFEVTDEKYTLDGIGIHPADNEALGSIGTNSFADAADGLMIFTYYEVVEDLDVYGIEILLTANSVPGGAIIAALHDTANVLAATADVTSAFAETEIFDVTQADIDAGFMHIMFESPVTLSSGGYYAGVEMFSNDSTANFRIVNDLTVPQPGNASLIYIPNDDVFTNGNAMAIRLMLQDPNGIADNQALQGISLYPNPSNGIVNIRTAQTERYVVEVFNVLGENVLTTAIVGTNSIDLSNSTAGVYMVRVSSANATMSQRIILN